MPSNCFLWASLPATSPPDITQHTFLQSKMSLADRTDSVTLSMQLISGASPSSWTSYTTTWETPPGICGNSMVDLRMVKVEFTSTTIGAEKQTGERRVLIMEEARFANTCVTMHFVGFSNDSPMACAGILLAPFVMLTTRTMIPAMTFQMAGAFANGSTPRSRECSR